MSASLLLLMKAKRKDMGEEHGQGARERAARHGAREDERGALREDAPVLVVVLLRVQARVWAGVPEAGVVRAAVVLVAVVAEAVVLHKPAKAKATAMGPATQTTSLTTVSTRIKMKAATL